MFKGIFKKALITLLFSLSFSPTFAVTGNLFKVSSTGNGAPVSITLCLTINGQSPLTCQNFTTQVGTLSINTVASNHTYHHVGIRVNTPGYTYTPGQGLKANAPSLALSATNFTPLCAAVSATEACGGALTSSTAATTYSSIYVLTNNCRVTYSIDSGATWASMLNQQCGWNWDNYSSLAVSTSGAMYMATKVTGAGTVIYTADGVTWTPMTVTWPGGDVNDRATIVYTYNNTLYVGTNNGYVLYTADNGANWTPFATQPDGSAITSMFVSPTGTLYVGTNNNNVFSSSNNGVSWANDGTPDNSAVLGLAVTTNGTLYVVTVTTEGANAPPKYFNGITWVSMGALPAGNNGADSVSAYGATVYAGTSAGNVLYTTDNGANWTTLATKPDGSAIESLFINQSTLSPLFVEAASAIPVNGAAGTVIVKNLSDATVSGVHAVIPAALGGVAQSGCSSSLPPQGTCTLSFTSTTPYAPQALDVVGTGTSGPIFRVALAFSMNGYVVYNVDSTYAYIVDNADAVHSTAKWVPAPLISIWGIAENSTNTSPSPNSTSAQPATQFTTPILQQDCNGATDGSCNSLNIYTYYQSHATGAPVSLNNYAEGLCYQSSVDGAVAGQWYLPSICELGSGLFFNDNNGNTPQFFASCTPVPTGVSSLYGLGLATALNAGNYWSSTEFSGNPKNFAGIQGFASGGGSSQNAFGKGSAFGVRCVRALPF